MCLPGMLGLRVLRSQKPDLWLVSNHEGKLQAGQRLGLGKVESVWRMQMEASTLFPSVV